MNEIDELKMKFHAREKYVNNHILPENSSNQPSQKNIIYDTEVSPADHE